MEKGKQLMQEFEAMKDMAELRALSKHSLEIPPTESQFERMMELKKKILGE